MILAIDRVVKQEATERMYHKVVSHSGKLSRHCCEADVKFCTDYLGICKISQSNTLPNVWWLSRVLGTLRQFVAAHCAVILLVKQTLGSSGFKPHRYVYYFGSVNSELGRIWKQGSVAWYYVVSLRPNICIRELRKTMKCLSQASQS